MGEGLEEKDMTFRDNLLSEEYQKQMMRNFCGAKDTVEEFLGFNFTNIALI